MYEMTLFIAGKTVKSEKDIKDLKAFLEFRFKGQFTLKIIDILENPELANEEMILVTPTLLKRLPHPVRKVVGDFRDGEKVLAGLGIELDYN